MAVCDWCKQEMNDADSCAANTVVEFPDGAKVPSVAYNGWLMNRVPEPGSELDGLAPLDRCRDCGIARGGFHHPGCDTEACPRCGGQLISCGCLDEDDA